MTLSSLLILLSGVAPVLDPGAEGSPCRNPILAWAGGIGDGASAFGMAINSAGDVFVCGRYYGGADLDPTEGVYQPETHGFTSDAYVIKVNSDGSFAWAYTVGGSTGTDAATGVAFAPSGDIIVAGGFEGTVDFDPTDGVDEYTSLGYAATFVTWLSPEGAYLDTLIQTGSGEAGATDFVLDRDANIILIGFFDGWIDFDPGPDVWMGVGVSDVFVSKLGPDGSHLWTHTIGSWGLWDGPEGIAVDSEGNVLALGLFRGTVDFDPGSGVDQHTVVGSVENLFITKYYPDGSYAWTRTYDVQGYDIAATLGGGVVMTGIFRNTVDFDPTEGVDIRTSSREYDIFVTKLTADGSYAWTYTVDGPAGGATGSGVTVADDGSILVVGALGGTVDLDPGPGVDIYTAASDVAGDALLLSLSNDGWYRWARAFGGVGSESVQHVAALGDETIYLVGRLVTYLPPLDSPPDLDPGCEVHLQRPHSEGSSEIFISKLVCPELSADFDGNGVVDLRDAAEFQECFTDEGPTTCGDGCSRLDLDPDDDIDLDDYTAFRKRLTGPQPRDLITPTSPITTHRERPLQE